MNTPQALRIGVLAVAALFASSANAQPGKSAAFYSAELSAPVEKTVEVVQGVVWKCEGTSCVAAKTTARPANVCARLSRKMGSVASFTAKGEAFDAEAISACNS